MSIKNFVKALIAGENVIGAFTKTGLERNGIYGQVVDMQADIIHTYHDLKLDVNAKMSDILVLMNRKFGKKIKVDEKNVAFQQVRALFKAGYVDTLDEDALKELLIAVVPVAVMRNLLARQKVSFNPKLVTGWDEFVDLYADAILQA